MRGGAELRELQKRMAIVKSAGFRQQLLKQLSIEGLHQVAVSFDKECDPYDRKWQALQHPGPKRRGGKILSDRGRLRNGFRAGATPESFTISNRVVYAARHQYGGSSLGVRQLMYHNKRGRFIRASRAAKANRVSFHPGGNTIATPARPFLPSEGRLGRRWTVAFTAISVKVMARALGKEKAGGGR